MSDLDDTDYADTFPGGPSFGRYTGRTVAEYKVCELVGRGASASVYAAEHLAGGPRVAIKIMKTRWSNLEGPAQRFEREVRTAALVRHPRIVRLLDDGVEDDGTRWQVLELLHGRDLASVLIERSLTAPEAIELAHQLLEALDAVHERGFVHRDVKPENIFVLNSSGELITVKLLDFGIAKPLLLSPSMPAITASGMLLGTPQYMAPEQITADVPVTPASDLWGVGAVLFHALTGRPPFEAKGLSRLLVKIAREAAPKIGLFRSDLPAALERVIDQALRRQPIDRFRSAEEMADALPA